MRTCGRAPPIDKNYDARISYKITVEFRGKLPEFNESHECTSDRKTMMRPAKQRSPVGSKRPLVPQTGISGLLAFYPFVSIFRAILLSVRSYVSGSFHPKCYKV